MRRSHSAITGFSLVLGLATGYLTNKVSNEWTRAYGLGFVICGATFVILEVWRSRDRTKQPTKSVDNLPPRNARFVGRQDYLDGIRHSLGAKKRGAVHVVNGIGAVGKTTLALEYSHKYRADYDVAWWINAEDPSLIDGQIALLGMALWPDQPWSEGDRPRMRALHHLANSTRWLLIFDNAVDPRTIRGYLPPGPGHILITSRSSGWQDISDAHQIEVFTRQESVAALTQGIHLAKNEADRIAEALGDLPLAIAQAHGYLAVTSDPQGYLEDLTARTSSTLSIELPATYPTGLAATIGLGIERLTASFPEARSIIDACAFLAPVEIPIHYLATTHIERSDLPAALAQIRNLGLATVAPGTVKFHRLTQAVVRAGLNLEQSIKALERARQCLAASSPGPSELPENWAAWTVLTPHLLAVSPEDSTDPLLRRLARHVAWVLHLRGEFNASLNLAERLETGWSRQSPPYDRDVLWAAGIQGRSLVALGEYERARQLDERVFSIFLEKQGWANVDTLAIALNLASDLRRLNRAQEALEIDTKALRGSRTALGVKHRNTLIAANNVAADLCAVGRLQEAHDLDQQTLTERRAILGPDHPDSLISMAAVARDLRSMGFAKRAGDLDAQVFRSRTKIFGDHHRATIRAAHSLVKDYRALRRYDQMLLLQLRMRRVNLLNLTGLDD